jgi:hypothetical protein
MGSGAKFRATIMDCRRTELKPPTYVFSKVFAPELSSPALKGEASNPPT